MRFHLDFKFLLVYYRYLKGLSSSANERQQIKLKHVVYRRIHSTNNDFIVVNSSLLHLTFVTFCLLSVVCKQQFNRFYVISIEFLSLKRRLSSLEKAKVAKNLHAGC